MIMQGPQRELELCYPDKGSSRTENILKDLQSKGESQTEERVIQATEREVFKSQRKKEREFKPQTEYSSPHQQQ